MENQNYNTSITTNATQQNVFNAIQNVPGWWSTAFEGSVDEINDVFTVRFGEVYITSKVVELIPGKKIAWQVIDCNKPWLKDTKEWNGTTMVWEIATKDDKTQLRFTHIGLAPEVECYEVCSNAWGQYLTQSLTNLINTGKGKPTVAKA